MMAGEAAHTASQGRMAPPDTYHTIILHPDAHSYCISVKAEYHYALFSAMLSQLHSITDEI